LSVEDAQSRQGGGSAPIGCGQNSNLLSRTSLRLVLRVSCFRLDLNYFPSSSIVSSLSPHPTLLLLLRFPPTMAGGGGKYRHLGRKSSHRQALLRNLVTSLFENESITTTWHKAKEAQRLADKLITLGKKNSEASRRRALEIFYVRTLPLGFTNAPLKRPDSSYTDYTGYSILFKQWTFPLIRIETTRRHTQTLRPPPRTLRRPARRIHPRAPRRT
jgi:ribosomal protein L17